MANWLASSAKPGISFGGQIYCGDSRFLLQNIVFGYGVSGSVGAEVRNSKILCGLIRDSDLNTTLKHLRELKSIGVKNENCSSEKDISLEMLKQRVHFQNGRYEVILLWKGNSNDLSDNFNLEKRRLVSPMRRLQVDKVYKIRSIVSDLFSSPSDNKKRISHNETANRVFDASACEIRVLKEEMETEKSDEGMELPQTTEKVLPLEDERAKMLRMDPDAVAQPVNFGEEKGLSRVQSISADEMCEEKEETSVGVIKATAKEDINPVILSKEPVDLYGDEIEERRVFKAKPINCLQIMSQLSAEKISPSFPFRTWVVERVKFYDPVRSLLKSKNQEINRLQLAVKLPWAIFFESVDILS
ncbi:uncharacterized protein TNCV_1030681 [Trichonephila clavipes]|nr:uncharacterized protein TNCV_1030681 [Trichonephila clavipes]